jgi:DNA (cytosine-5)-methyltransferase 1
VTQKLRVLDLFSGIGGFSLGLERTGGFETVAFCEFDERKRQILAGQWPSVRCFSDVAALSGDQVPGRPVDVVAGGFPCQDVSHSGRRAGLAGERSGLWTHFARLIRELRPRFAIVENVPGLLSRGMGDVLGDLASSGYDAEWDCIPAAAVGAPHLRARIWLLAYPRGFRDEADDTVFAGRSELVIHPRWAAEPDTPRVDDGTAAWVLRSAGAALVPQIPELIGKAILEAEGTR